MVTFFERGGERSVKLDHVTGSRVADCGGQNALTLRKHDAASRQAM